jgi:hypothetical protein
MTTLAYFEGEIIPIEQATVSITCNTLHYGTGCFGGLRGYWNDDHRQLYLFRVRDHYRRFSRQRQAAAVQIRLHPGQAGRNYRRVTARRRLAAKLLHSDPLPTKMMASFAFGCTMPPTRWRFLARPSASTWKPIPGQRLRQFLAACGGLGDAGPWQSKRHLRKQRPG